MKHSLTLSLFALAATGCVTSVGGGTYGSADRYSPSCFDGYGPACAGNAMAAPEMGDIERRYYAAAREVDERNARYLETASSIQELRTVIAQKLNDRMRASDSMARYRLEEDIRVLRGQLSQAFPRLAAQDTQRREAKRTYDIALQDYVDLLTLQGRSQEVAAVQSQSLGFRDSLEFAVSPYGTRPEDGPF